MLWKNWESSNFFTFDVRRVKVDTEGNSKSHQKFGYPEREVTKYSNIWTIVSLLYLRLPIVIGAKRKIWFRIVVCFLLISQVLQKSYCFFNEGLTIDFLDAMCF